MDVSYLIILRTYNSLFYFGISSITHRLELPVTLANTLRLLGGILDLTILVILLLSYILEWCESAYKYPILGVGALIFICGVNWVAHVWQKQRVQPVFIIAVITTVLFLITFLAFSCLGLSYKTAPPALLVFYGGYSFCWLIFSYFKKVLISFAKRIGENLRWIDPLMGNMQHHNLALRNVCSLNLSLLNLTYVHTTGGAANIMVILIGLALAMNILIGLRLIKVSESVKLHDGFMVQIIKHGYDNITTLYNQLKNKTVPKATWYAWVITLITGLTFSSPSYCMAPDTSGGPMIDASLDGQGKPELEEGVSSPISEGAAATRIRQAAETIGRHTRERVGQHLMDAPADAIRAGMAGAAASAGAAAYQMTQGNDQPIVDDGPSQLEVANERANRAEAELASVKKWWVYRWFGGCLGAPTFSQGDSNNPNNQ